MSIRKFKIMQNRSEKELHEYALELYDIILEYSLQIFGRTNPLMLIRETDMLDVLIYHFESYEEYEKCLRLVKTKKCLNGIL
jgi:hypothetical protein